MFRKLFFHSTLYSLSNLFTSLAGLISFPILTKNLSVEEYGAVGLFTITTGLIASINKIGLQHSIMRFGGELDHQSMLANIFYPSLFIILLSSSLILGCGLILGNFTNTIIFTTIPLVIIISSAILESVRSIIENILISKQMSLPITFFSFIQRLLSLSSIIIIILFITKSSIGFIIAILIADLIFTAILISWCIYKKIITSFIPIKFKIYLFTPILAFGLPMLGSEAANMLHAFIDRYFIEYYLGPKNLGIYSASYNMANIICKTLVGGLVIAIVPVYLSTWKNEGKIATEKLLNQVNRIYVLIAPAIIAGLYIIATPLLLILASKEYADYSYLLPIIATGVLIASTSIIFAAGLQIRKNSRMMMVFVIESLIINIILNVIFIPIFGITAAATITVISYIWYSQRLYFEGKKTLEFKFPIFYLLKSITYSILMVTIGLQISFESAYLELISKITFGVLFYSIMILIFERDNLKNILPEINEARYNN